MEILVTSVLAFHGLPLEDASSGASGTCLLQRAAPIMVDLRFDFAEPRTQQVIQLLLTAPSKHGCEHRKKATTVLMPVCKQPQVSPNFFQAPTPPSHSTSLTFVLTTG
jgi:hypothetical protein